MSKKDKSVFLDKDKFIQLTSKASSVGEVLEAFGLAITGGNYRTYYRYCEKYGVQPPKSKDRGIAYAHNFNLRPYEEILVENSTYKSTDSLKRRLLRDSILEEKCALCGQTNEWNGKPLTLQLDHINGVNNDNRLENLRILCPNCHTQTKTYGNKRRTKKDKVKREPVYKIEWPTLVDLLTHLKTMSIVELATSLKVSDNAVRKRLLNMGVDVKRLAWHRLDREEYIEQLLSNSTHTSS